MSRRPIIAGNWKMHNNREESKNLVCAIKDAIKDIDKDALPEVVVAPVFTSLDVVSENICKCGCGRIQLAAQNCYYEAKGAFTGEVSIDMIKDFDANFIIIGHSERRQLFSETDEMINKKAKATKADAASHGA